MQPKRNSVSDATSQKDSLLWGVMNMRGTREPRIAPDEMASAQPGLPGGGGEALQRSGECHPGKQSPPFPFVLGEDSGDWSQGHNFG